MKVMILAGGLGTRLSEEKIVRPKPMVEIGGKPMLWHIMKIYSLHGINEFVDLPRLQGRRDQGVLPPTTPAHLVMSRFDLSRTIASTSRTARPKPGA